MNIKCKKKEVFVEAMQYEGTVKSAKEIVAFIGGDLYDFVDGRLFVPTSTSSMRLCKSDYVVKHCDGTTYAWKKHIFEDVYEQEVQCLRN